MTTKYEMWLTHDAEREKIQVPVLPESIKIRNGSKNGSVNIIGLGEIVIMQDRPALQFSFSSFFPATKFPGIQVTELRPPLSLIRTINDWKASKKPVHLIVTVCGIDLYCSIENFEYREDGGDPGTYHYSLAFKEYREITIRQVEVNVDTNTGTVSAEPPRVDNSVQPRTYTVKKGDCLWNIAKKFYGKGSLYKKIYEANKETIGTKNPDLIFPGQILIIP